MSKQIHYVYVLQRRDKPGEFTYQNLFFSFEPFYVGKGSKRELNGKAVYDRLFHTIHNGNDHKMNILKKLNYEAEVSLFFFETEEEAFQKETSFIQKIGRKDKGLGPLSNWCDGGKFKVDRESYFKRTAKYDTSGKLLEIFMSAEQAKEITKVSNISRACTKKILAGGFFWRNFKKNEKIPDEIEVGNYFVNRIHNGNKPREILVIDELGNKKRYSSIKEASISTGVGSPTICRACKNRRTYNGFKFQYAAS